MKNLVLISFVLVAQSLFAERSSENPDRIQCAVGQVYKSSYKGQVYVDTSNQIISGIQCSNTTAPDVGLYLRRDCNNYAGLPFGQRFSFSYVAASGRFLQGNEEACRSSINEAGQRVYTCAPTGNTCKLCAYTPYYVWKTTWPVWMQRIWGNFYLQDRPVCYVSN